MHFADSKSICYRFHGTLMNAICSGLHTSSDRGYANFVISCKKKLLQRLTRRQLQDIIHFIIVESRPYIFFAIWSNGWNNPYLLS